MSVVAVIGGSGLYDLPGLDHVAEHRVDTPWGEPSDAVLEGRVGGQVVLFLPRHGRGHRLTPSEVPYAANIHALKQLGAARVISVSAVGSLAERFAPGHLVLPDQFIDLTTRRRSTFFGEGVAAHVSLADPVCAALRRLAFECAQAEPGPVADRGTYLCMEGPQFSTRAESNLYRQWGCEIIGMTNATEAKLAREAGLCYASLCFVTDYDCWKTGEAPVELEQILKVLQANVDRGRRIVRRMLDRLGEMAACDCGQAATRAVVTAPELISATMRERLRLVLGPRQ